MWKKLKLKKIPFIENDDRLDDTEDISSSDDE